MIRKLTFIAAAAAVCASATAGPVNSRIAISSGASAVKGNFALALKQLCETATPTAGVFTEFQSGNNISTYVCANSTVTGAAYAGKPDAEFINFKDTGFAEVRLNVSNGSFTAVCLIQPTGWPAVGATACPAADTYLVPGGSLAVRPAGSQIVGGVLDVQPTAWPPAVLTGLTVPAGTPLNVAQAFGLAVSSSLYTKLFNAQLAPAGQDATVSKPIPSSCTVGDTAKLQCIPTVSRAAMATVMAGDEFNTAGANGVGFLTGDAAQNGQTLIYARRTDTSGTQAAAQVFFLGLPCMKNPLPIAAGGTIAGALDIRNLGSTGNVRTVLTGAGDAIGIMSGENNQSESWRWVRINGAPLGENAAPASAGITNSATMLNGQYEFWFEATYVSQGSGPANAFWTAVSNSLNTLAAPVGLINKAQLESAGAFKKGGQTCSYSVGN